MEATSLPYHLLIPAAVSFVLVFLLFFTRKRIFRKRKILWISLLVFFSCYLFICGVAAYDVINIQIESAKYDLNKNGVYEESELTEEAKHVLSKISNDTGRNFAIVTGFVFALILSITTFLFSSLLDKVLKRNKG